MQPTDRLGVGVKNMRQGPGHVDKNVNICFNTKRKQHSMNSQNALRIWSRCINLQHFYIMAKCNMLTPEPGFHGDAWLPHQPAQRDRADVISPPHKHLCLQEQRKKEASLLENGKEIEVKMRVALKKNKRPH